MLAVQAHVHNGSSVIDGVVDRRRGVRVEGDVVAPEHAERHDAAVEAGADAADAVVRTCGGDARDRRAVTAAGRIGRVRVPVHEVVPGQDRAGEVGMRRVDAGVDDRDDDVRRAGRDFPGLGKVQRRVCGMGRVRVAGSEGARGSSEDARRSTRDRDRR